jgi:predicted dehydrogenase
MEPNPMNPSPRPGSPATVKSFNISRRAFLSRCSLIAAMTGLPLWFIERQQLAAEDVPATPSPNDRPGIALIGCGGQGSADAKRAADHGDIVAVCDVDQGHATRAAKRFTVGDKVPAIFSDFRKVMEQDNVHIIVNGTPDHWHTLVNMACAKARKDVYAEKPLTLTIDEGRRLVKVVQASGIVLQTGTQQRSDPRFRLACELVRNNRIGRLLRANVWLPAGLRGGPFPAVPVPAGLDWDFWQGQTPATPYVKERCFANFRYWYDYSGGTMTDWGAHHNDIAYWAIGLLAPTHVESTRLSEPIPGGYTAIADYKVKYTYANGIDLNINSTEDETPYGEPKDKKHPKQRNGIRFEGTDGWIWVNRDGISSSDPQLVATALPQTAVKFDPSKAHMANFFDCVRSRQQPVCDVATGHRSATMCHLATISLRTEKKLTWDPDKEEFTGWHARLANTYISREMRKPYDYSFVG